MNTWRFLAQKQREEENQFQGTQPLTGGSELVPRLRRPHWPMNQKIWSAKVRLLPRECQLPPRELVTVSRHVQRMQLGHELQSQQQPGLGSKHPKGVQPRVRRDPSARDQSREEGTEEAETVEAVACIPRKPRTQKHVAFKNEKSLKCPQVCRQESKFHLIREKAQPNRLPQSSGCAKANRSHHLALANFPGDLLLMGQNFTEGVNVPRVP